MEEILRMEGISKRFKNFYANKNINLSILNGEVHTLLGENGAGKSTLMNILIGLYQPTEGKIFFKGKEVRIESPDRAARLGNCFSFAGPCDGFQLFRCFRQGLQGRDDLRLLHQ